MIQEDTTLLPHYVSTPPPPPTSMVAKERQLQENRMFCYQVDYFDPWNLKYMKPSHNDKYAVSVAHKSTSRFDEFNNSVTNVQQRFRRRYRGKNGELVWQPGSQSVQYSCPRLKWTQCANYWWTFMNTVINLWGFKGFIDPQIYYYLLQKKSVPLRW